MRFHPFNPHEHNIGKLDIDIFLNVFAKSFADQKESFQSEPNCCCVGSAATDLYTSSTVSFSDQDGLEWQQVQLISVLTWPNCLTKCN